MLIHTLAQPGVTIELDQHYAVAFTYAPNSAEVHNAIIIPASVTPSFIEALRLFTDYVSMGGGVDTQYHLVSLTGAKPLMVQSCKGENQGAK